MSRAPGTLIGIALAVAAAAAGAAMPQQAPPAAITPPVRYDQLADRWLIVMPLFRRGPARADQPPVWQARDAVYVSPPGMPGQPGPAVPLFQPLRPAC
jgi:hypothetical protein